MAEAAAHRSNVYPGGQELGGAEVAEVVELHAREVEFVPEARERKRRVVGAPRLREVDLVGEEAARERFGVYEKIGYPVLYTAAKSSIGIDDARRSLGGRRSVLTGPSGVGKSSLLNAIFPGSGLRVGEISESVNKGRHTTVGAKMLPLPGDDDGYVIDTPGLREVGMWLLPSEHLDRCFPEMREPRERCRFGDCRHVAEPECAVRDAVDAGEITAERYDSYRRLLEEIEAES